MPHAMSTTSPTYYDILSLPTSLRHAPIIPSRVLKACYRKALLQYHPDKSAPLAATGAFSIDDISEAYATLSDTKLRLKYDAELNLLPNAAKRGGGATEDEWRTGIEVVDLDDLDGGEGKEEGSWWRSCRCGDEKGFLVEERDLEEAERDGGREVLVGCRGCSLWLRVGFGVLEGE